MSDSMQPFRIEIPQADVEYLHDRLANARWPGSCPAWNGPAACRWAT